MITEELIAQYERDGAVCVRGAVDPQTAESVLQNIDTLIADTNDRWTTIRDGGFSDRHLWPTMPWMYDICANSGLPEIVGRLMRSSQARLFFDHIFVRDAGTTQSTPWHQDRPYWPFLGRQIASVWIALTPCDEESSAVRYVRGSHNWGKVYRPKAFGQEGGSSEFLGESAAFEKIPDIDGDAIVFGAEIVHGAYENKDESRRRAAMSIRYIGDDAIWDPRDGTDPIVTPERVGVKPGEAPENDEWFPKVWSAS